MPGPGWRWCCQRCSSSRPVSEGPSLKEARGGWDCGECKAGRRHRTRRCLSVEAVVGAEPWAVTKPYHSSVAPVWKMSSGCGRPSWPYPNGSRPGRPDLKVGDAARPGRPAGAIQFFMAVGVRIASCGDGEPVAAVIVKSPVPTDDDTKVREGCAADPSSR